MSEDEDEDQNMNMEYQQQSDYERLRDQCLNAMNELETLRRQHAEILNRCEIAAQDADYFHKQYKATLAKLDQSEKEQQTFVTKYENILFDRDKLKQDYEEIVLLREQEKLESNKPKLNVTTNSACKEDITLEELQQENEELKYSFDDLRAEHEILISNQKQNESEVTRLREQIDTVLSERDNVVVERNALKQQCGAAIRGYEKALRERDEVVKENVHLKQQCESTDRELQQAIKVKMQMSKDIMKLRDERNSALNEYKLVMSERDTVHQEIEKLQDDLKQEKAKTEKVQDEKEKVSLEKEGLRHEVIAVLADRDQAVKEVHDLRNRLQLAIKEKETSVKHLEEQMHDYEMLKQERNAAKKERGEAIVHRDKILKECFEVKRLFEKMDSGESNETEGLKVQFDKLSSELTHAWNAAEVSMTRRDWAFSERDKVKQELEELKEEHYEVKKLKDVSDAQYNELFKQHDILQKQYTELYSQLGSFKKIYTENDLKHLRTSQDSALDADAPSYHIESIMLNRTVDSEDFGFRIDGGCDKPLSPHDPSIFVVEIIKGSMADGKLKINDCIIHVNNVDMTSIDFHTAYEAINSTNYLNITILRHCKSGVKSPIQRIEIKSNEEKNIGLSIDSGLHIKRIEPGSAAAEEETLSIGDKILSVNGQSIENMPYTEAKKLLKTSNLSLTILKPSVSTTSSHRSLQNNIEETECTDHHFRSTSAPIYINANMHESNRPSNPTHVRNSSVVQADLDITFKKDLFLGETGRTQMYSDDRLSSKNVGKDTLSDVTNPSSNFFLPVNVVKRKEASKTNPVLSPVDIRRPMSAHGSSRQSFSSNSSISRFSYDFSRITPSSPLNINRSDPLALSPRTFGQASSASNTSVNSGGRSSHVKRGRKPFHTTGRNSGYLIQSYHDGLFHHPISHHWKPLSEVFPVQTNTSSNTNSLERHYGTFPGKPSKFTDDLPPDRLNSHTSMTTSKGGSNRSVGGNYKSCSSHGSWNSSEFSDKAIVGGKYEPVHEETVESLLEFSSSNPLSSPRSSGRRKSLQKPVSPTFTLKSKSPKQARKSINQEEEEPRVTVLEKGQYPLGITIAQGQNNGIFVAGVTEDSIAARKGLRYGDQLLEYNGINLRMASYEQAALILKQSAVESTVTVLVQYNPHKMNETTDNLSSAHSTPHVTHRVLPAASPLITPRTTPLTKRCFYTPPSTPASFHGRLNSNTSSSSDHSKLTTADLKITSILESGHVGDPRLVRILREPSSTPLGIGIIGGNAVGIFISDIQKDTLAEMQPGLRCGDQILRYNARDMNNCTLEEATLELGKPTEVCHLDVQYNPPGYLKAQVENGDSIYVRALYDRVHPPRGELPFRKGDIMRVTDTLYKGQLGVWRAFIVEESEGESFKRNKGKIPSKGKAEQELLLRRTSTYGEDKLKGRKSLFRRSKKGSHGYTVNHSRESSDSKQGDGSEGLSSSLSSAVSCLFSTDGLLAYQYVKKYDTTYPRPLVLIGALSEPICDKLTIDYAAKFSRALPEIVETTKDSLETKVKEGIYLDYKLSRKGDRYECTTLKAIHYVIYDKSKHCVLDVNHESLDRFTSLKIHPIIVYVKYKSPKHIKDMRDGRFIREKISSKYAKDVFEQYIRIEKECKHMFTVTMQAHSLNSVCKEINECVTEHQKRTLWISYD